MPGDSLRRRLGGGGRPAGLGAGVVRHGNKTLPATTSLWKTAVEQVDATCLGKTGLAGRSCQNRLYLRQRASPPHTDAGVGSLAFGGDRLLTHQRRGRDTNDQDAASQTKDLQHNSLSNRSVRLHQDVLDN